MSLQQPILGVTDTLEQIEYFEAVRKAIVADGSMSTVELVRVFRDNHPDTLRGAKVAVMVGDETKLIRRGELAAHGITVVDPTKAGLQQQLKNQVEAKLNDTPTRDNDKRDDARPES